MDTISGLGGGPRDTSGTVVSTGPTEGNVDEDTLGKEGGLRDPSPCLLQVPQVRPLSTGPPFRLDRGGGVPPVTPEVQRHPAAHRRPPVPGRPSPPTLRTSVPGCFTSGERRGVTPPPTHKLFEGVHSPSLSPRFLQRILTDREDMAHSRSWIDVPGIRCRFLSLVRHVLDLWLSTSFFVSMSPVLTGPVVPSTAPPSFPVDRKLLPRSQRSKSPPLYHY